MPTLARPVSGNVQLAIAEIYREHGYLVLRRAQQILGDEQEAHEVLQEVFLSLVHRPGQFAGQSAITTWLYSATTHNCLNRLRNHKNRARLLEQRVAPAVANPGPPTSAAWVAARQVVAKMPERLAKVAILYFVDEMTQEEIAEVVGCSRRQVSNLVAQARSWVKEHLQ